MKKLVLTVCAAMAFATAFAQQEAPAKMMPPKMGRHSISMPKKGNIGIGVDATPFLTYIGGFFSNQGAQAPIFTTNDPLTINGRYFLEDNRALNVALSMGFNGTTTETKNATNASATDKKEVSTNVFGVTAAYEFRRTAGRIVASYGPSIGYKYASNTGGYIKFTDGNNNNNNYTTEGGNTNTFAVGGVFTLEYFVTSNIAISGRWGLDYKYSFTSERTNQVGNKTSVQVSPEASAYGFGNNSTSGIGLSIYF